MKKSARQLRSMMRNRTRTRSWTKKGLRSERVKRPKLGISRPRKKTILTDIPLPYMHIECNEFVHRGHKQLVEDDIPVCSCKVLKGDFESACGDRCLNVLTSNECTLGFCPCGELCKNQRFQRRKYVKTKLVKTDERGWGLLADQAVKMGEFIIEYCGEVISCEEARIRSQAYEADGLQDAYIISLSGSESIDATKKGSLARFINHSCDPNCETRKWTVLGEVRVGIFAKQDIEEGMELTYNYNFEWYGGAKVRCLCGAAPCVGFLGAKSRGFQKDSYVWEDNDDRYSVENVPLYDSEDDEPLSNFLKRAQVSNKLRKASTKTTVGPPPPLPGLEGAVESPIVNDREHCLETKISSLDITGERSSQQLPIVSEIHLVEEEVATKNRSITIEKDIETVVKKESIVMDTVQENVHNGPISEKNDGITNNEATVDERICLAEHLGLTNKRSRILAPEQSKSTSSKRGKVRSVYRLLPSKTARDEVFAAEEEAATASAELDRLHEKLRPVVEDLGKDGQDNLSISSAEEWITATCKQLRAVFDLNFSVVRNLSYLSSGISSETQIPS